MRRPQPILFEGAAFPGGNKANKAGEVATCSPISREQGP